MILVLTGPPGAGKSTIGRRVAEGFERSAHLHTDDFYAWLVSGYVEPWKPGSQAQNATVVDAIVAAARAFEAGGYDVVVDGIVGPWFLEPFGEVDYCVLLPSAAAAHARAAARVGHSLPDLAIVGQMHDTFTAHLDGFGRHVVDTTDLTVDETVDEVRRRLASGDLRLDGGRRA